MVDMSDTLVRWLNNEMNQHGLSLRGMAKLAGTSHTTVSDVLSGIRPPTWDFCVKVAGALKVSPERVLRMAGHLPPAPETTLTPIPRLQSFADRLARLSPERQRKIMEAALMLLEINDYAVASQDVGGAASADAANDGRVRNEVDASGD